MHAAQASADTPCDRVSLPTKFSYGIGAAAAGTKNVVFNTFLLFYYNQVLGLPGTLSGLAIFGALCIDAITDPVMGSISDNCHSRWGRRHPFMYGSAVPMAVCFFLWHPAAAVPLLRACPHYRHCSRVDADHFLIDDR